MRESKHLDHLKKRVQTSLKDIGPFYIICGSFASALMACVVEHLVNELMVCKNL